MSLDPVSTVHGNWGSSVARDGKYFMWECRGCGGDGYFTLWEELIGNEEKETGVAPPDARDVTKEINETMGTDE